MDEAEIIAAMSMGSTGVARTLDQRTLLDQRQRWSGLLTDLKANDYRAALAAAETLAADREEAAEFLKWAESWYRDLLVYGLTHNTDELVNLDMRSQIEQQSAGGAASVLSALERIADAAAGVQRNLNRRLVLEKLLLGLVETP